ncbi:MAG: hypothetical protein KC482_06595 [Dehalococcoidia bacterium]|nr:hypothetical protein [Dehalococcoidia bacterium]MCA9853253.1 hypothetical protein [Dehalococcoidia bacterium]
MEPQIFLLTGFPGTGKYTVARALVEQLRLGGDTALLVDNHWINNPIFGLIESDGISPLLPEVWERVAEVRDAVFRTLEELTPRAWHVVTTAYLDGQTDLGYVERLAALSAARGSTFVPVRLQCEVDENVRRISLPERRERMKAVDPELPVRLALKGPPFVSGHANELSLDITARTPLEAARAVLAHAGTISPRG